MKREHSVRCHYCPIMVTDLTKTKTQIRTELRTVGWEVGVPLRLAVPEPYNEATMKGKTVDICPACMQRRMDDAMARINALHQQIDKEQAEVNLLEMPCPVTIQ